MYRSLSGCYEECGKQLQVIAGQVASNNGMVAKLAGRIASAEDLMTNHVAKVEERVQVLETMVEQELQSPGLVSGALAAQLSQLKEELGGMRQLMDEHPLQVAQKLQALERKVVEAPEMQVNISSNLLPVVQQEMQKVAATIMLDVEQRLQASEGRVLQTVGAEMTRMRAEMETAFTSIATHVANISQRQRMLEDTINQQMAAMVSHMQGNQMTAPSPSTSMAPVAPAMAPIRTASRGRSRSRSADAPGTRTTTPQSRPAMVQQAPLMPVVEDMETKMANALMVAMQRMGLATAAAAIPVGPVQPGTGSPQMLVNTTTQGMMLPRIDRSRQRGGRHAAVSAAMMPVLGGGMSNNVAAAAINNVQIAPVGAASPNMMVTMPVQLSAALLGAVPQKFSGDQQDWPEWRRRWLQVDDRVNHVARGSDDRGRRDDRQRSTREVLVEDTDWDAGMVAAVGGSGKGKPRPQSAEWHPKKGNAAEKQSEVAKEAEKKVEQLPTAVSAAPPSETPQGQAPTVPQWTGCLVVVCRPVGFGVLDTAVAARLERLQGRVWWRRVWRRRRQRVVWPQR